MLRKTPILIIVLTLAGAFACSGKNVKYNVKGSNAPKDGATVYLVDQTVRAPIDSAIVSRGSFELKGETEQDAFLAVVVSGSDGLFQFFNDGKPVTVNVAEDKLSGSDLNNKLADCNRRNKEAYAEYYKVIEDMESLPDDSPEEKVAEMMTKYRTALSKYANFFVGMIEENKGSLIPVAFVEQLPSLVSAADDWNKAKGENALDELLASNAQLASHPYVVDLKRRMAAADAQRQAAAERQRSYVGEKFRDLEEPDRDGAMHKLSEYVGRGKWVLVDFWASWCGPCKAEMPNVVAAYKKYHDKGFDIVGLSFDREKDPWIRAIREWDMPWIHLSDLKYWDTVARGVYNVNGIPDNLLIDPEGTIVARGLRGAALEARLAEIFN